jgi:ketosteroid isomerase-like protein
MLLLVACQKATAPAAAPGQHAAAASALRAVVEDYRSAINKRDLDRLLSFYAADGWQLAQNGAIATTDADRRAFWQAIQHLPISQDTVDVADRIEIADSGELAVQYGEFRQIYLDGKGGFKSVPQKFINSWRKQANGEWKLTASMASVAN